VIGALRPEEFQPNLSKRYVYGIQSGQFIKIGVAVDIAKRLNIMKLSNPHPLKVVFRRQMYAAFHCERKMHELLKPKALGREWFDVTIEEVRAAAAIGTAFAREVWKIEVCKAIPLGTPVTHILDDDAKSQAAAIVY
jgi:hypothetical protein